MTDPTDKHTQESGAARTPPPSAAGDHIAVNVGEGAAHVAAGKNILQIGSLSIPRWLALLIAVSLTAMAVLVGIAAWFNQQTSENTGRTTTILSYTPTPSPTVTLISSPTPTVELIASFLNLRQPGFAAADVDIEETERTQLANPSQYAQFVTRDLPGQMAFLALFALGQSYFLNNDYPAAINTIGSAVAAAGPADSGTTSGQTSAIAQGLAEAYFRLGWLYEQPPANLNASIASYSKVIELDPQNARAYNNRGVAYHDQGNLQQAIADYSRASAYVCQGNYLHWKLQELRCYSAVQHPLNPLGEIR